MQHSETQIRPPQWSDLPQFLECGRCLHEESWFGHTAYNETKVATAFYNLMIDTTANFCRVALKGDRLAGAIAGKATSHWFSDEVAVFDNFLYVRSEFRGSFIAYRLWKEMRDWAKSIGAKELTHGVGTAMPGRTPDKFFAGIGMVHVGGIYKMRL